MYTHLEDYIHNLYKSMNVTRPEQIDMHFIAHFIGVEITYKRSVFRFNNEIVLRKGTAAEEWIDFGHEICHYLRHSGSQLNMHRLFIDLQEYQANYFSYHFCVPTFMLEDFEFSRHHKDCIWNLAQTFNVPYNFAEKRLNMWLNRRIFVDNMKISR